MTNVNPEPPLEPGIGDQALTRDDISTDAVSSSELSDLGRTPYDTPVVNMSDEYADESVITDGDTYVSDEDLEEK